MARVGDAGAVNTDGDGGDRRRAPVDVWGQLAGVFLGAAGGMGINALSNDVGYRGAAAAAIGAVLTATRWLRRRPRAPLARFAPPVLLAVACAIAPRPPAGGC